MYNVILITIDSLRADHLSCLGHHRNITPNIDNLARKGVIFTQAFANGPYTSYSFPSILTSNYGLMYPLKTPFKGVAVLSAPVLIGGVTLAEVLKRNGYSTAAFHSNPLLSSYYAYNRGFDVFKELWSIGSDTLEKVKNHVIRRFYSKVLKLKSVKFLTSIMAKIPVIRKSDTSIINTHALNWLQQNISKPFFLWLHYMGPHFPYTPSVTNLLTYITAECLNYKLRYENDLLYKDEVKQLINLYDEKIKNLDYELKIFIENLENIGISRDNTYFILTSDHGEEFGEHGGFLHGSPAGIAKLYDELLHVPLIICGPNIPSNTVVRELVSLIDLAPTILDLLNLPIPKEFLGNSLVPLIKAQRLEREVGVISEYYTPLQQGYSYRTHDWKYILTFRGREIVEELYRLKIDPKERSNVVHEYKELAETFKRKIINHIHFEKRFRLIRKKIMMTGKLRRAQRRLRV